MEDKCGIVGIHCADESKNVASFVYYCLYALQHRGQESAGIATFNPINGLNCYCGMGLITEVFKNDQIQSLQGSKAIGHVRYSTTGQSKLENSNHAVHVSSIHFPAIHWHNNIYIHEYRCHTSQCLHFPRNDILFSDSRLSSHRFYIRVMILSYSYQYMMHV